MYGAGVVATPPKKQVISTNRRRRPMRWNQVVRDILHPSEVKQPQALGICRLQVIRAERDRSSG